MERMIQYVKDGTEAFDDPFPSGERAVRTNDTQLQGGAPQNAGHLRRGREASLGRGLQGVPEGGKRRKVRTRDTIQHYRSLFECRHTQRAEVFKG